MKKGTVYDQTVSGVLKLVARKVEQVYDDCQAKRKAASGLPPLASSLLSVACCLTPHA